MATQTLIEIKEELATDELEIKQYFGWGHQAHEQCQQNFVVITAKKGHPYPGCKGFRKLWKIGAVTTDKPVLSLSDYEPVIGEVCGTVEDETIELVSVDFV